MSALSLQRLFVGLTLAALAVALIFMGWNIGHEHPIQCRENADIFNTALLLKQQNPYGAGQPPGFCYLYGIGNALVTYPLASWLGPTLQVHRLVNCSALLLAGLVLAWGIRLSGVAWRLALCGGALLPLQLAYTQAISAKPDALALLFFLLSMVLPAADGYRVRALILCAVTTLCAFYTKPYFILGGPLVALYVFLFISKIRGAAFLAGLVALLVFSIAVAGRIMPLYFTDTFYIHVNSTQRNLWHLIVTLIRYAPIAAPFVLIIARAWLSEFRGGDGWKALNSASFDFLQFDQPLIVRPHLHFATCSLVVCSVIYLILMGPHPGNDFQYLMHIIAPFLIWRAMIVVGVGTPKRRDSFLLLSSAVLIMILYLAVPVGLHAAFNYGREQAAWKKARDLITQHHDVYASRMFAGILYDEGRPVYETGYTDYWPGAFPHNPIPAANADQVRYQAFEAEITRKLQARRFDLVLIIPNLPPFFPIDILHANYHQVDSFYIYMTYNWPHIDYNVQVWEPNGA